MNKIWIVPVLGFAALAGCDESMTTDTAMRTGTPTAESACIAAVNRNMADSGTTVTSSDFSEAGTTVTMRASDGSNWRCLASNDGVVEDLSVTG